MDLSGLVGINAKLIATVYGENQGPDEVNVVGIQTLRIESDKPLRVKGIKPLVNGVFSPSNSTYTAVDTVVGGSANYADQVIETGGANGSIILASWEKDSLSFSFDSIEVAGKFSYSQKDTKSRVPTRLFYGSKRHLHCWVFMRSISPIASKMGESCKGLSCAFIGLS